MFKFLKRIDMKLKFSVIQKLKEEIIDSHNHVSQRLRSAGAFRVGRAWIDQHQRILSDWNLRIVGIEYAFPGGNKEYFCKTVRMKRVCPVFSKSSGCHID